MALDTYDNLKASVAAWLRRTDLTSLIPDFITLAEAQMNRTIRSRRKVIRATSSVDAEFMDLPDDFAGVRSFKLTGATPPRTLASISTEQMAALKDGQTDTSGTPSYYAIVGAEFEFDKVPSSAIDAEIAYTQTIPALSGSNPSNWILASHPDAYLYGALLQSAPYLKADERLGTWANLFSSVVADINDMSMSESMGGAMSMSPNTVPV